MQYLGCASDAGARIVTRMAHRHDVMLVEDDREARGQTPDALGRVAGADDLHRDAVAADPRCVGQRLKALCVTEVARIEDNLAVDGVLLVADIGRARFSWI